MIIVIYLETYVDFVNISKTAEYPYKMQLIERWSCRQECWYLKWNCETHNMKSGYFKYIFTRASELGESCGVPTTNNNIDIWQLSWTWKRSKGLSHQPVYNCLSSTEVLISLIWSWTSRISRVLVCKPPPKKEISVTICHSWVGIKFA